MNKKFTAATLSVAMAATMAPAIMQTAPVQAASGAVPVSYTHLTLPTKLEV